MNRKIEYRIGETKGDVFTEFYTELDSFIFPVLSLMNTFTISVPDSMQTLPDHNCKNRHYFIFYSESINTNRNASIDKQKVHYGVGENEQLC